MIDAAAWIGRQEVREDRLDPGHVADLAATLGRIPAPGVGDALPPGWHWAFFNRFVPAAETGPDGHPLRGGFLPPVDLPRRMWAGGRLTFSGRLPIGTAATRVSTIARVERKRGRSGELAFVTVRHDIAVGTRAAVGEEHDIVYRGPATGVPSAPAAAPADATWRRRIDPDPVLLFRYSALTRNPHRIHYDAPYATAGEGYPGLVVHGPLIATFLMELVAVATPRPLARFAFRAVAPLFAGAPFTVNAVAAGDGLDLWAAGPDGGLAMTATAALV